MEFAAEILSSRAGAGRAYGEQLDMMAKYDQVNPSALKKLLAGGTKLHAFSPEIMQASFKSAMELYAEISATNPNFKKVYASLTDFANDGYQWWQVAELGFDSFMVRNRLSG